VVSGTGGTRSASDHDDPADWACHIAERLPGTDIRRLADAAAKGQTEVRALRASAASPALRQACDHLIRHLLCAEPAFLAGLLIGAAKAVVQTRRSQSVSVVWTGPASHVTNSRLTAATVVDLIARARSTILLVSFATRTEQAISAALQAAAGRGVEIILLAERHADNPSYSATDTPFPGLTALRLYWPAANREPGAALHAKIVVVDNEIALVGSANLTNRAMETNLECGVLIRGGPQPQAIRDHITDLYATGRLHRLRRGQE